MGLGNFECPNCKREKEWWEMVCEKCNFNEYNEKFEQNKKNGNTKRKTS